MAPARRRAGGPGAGEGGEREPRQGGTGLERRAVGGQPVEGQAGRREPPGLDRLELLRDARRRRADGAERRVARGESRGDEAQRQLSFAGV